MKAVYIAEFGGPEHLEVREVPDPPRPEGSQVLVRVRAAGLNRADLVQRRGNYPPPAGYSPNIPGLEFAGEVVEVGPLAKIFKPGERVFGITAGEAQAVFVLIDESVLIKIPDGLNFVEAAALPEAFITAHDAVFTQAALGNDETLLIHAVGSGVGLAALQMAKARGATVIGTSRTAEKLEKCREFGLDLGIVTGKPPQFASEVREFTSGRGADVVLDLVGAAYFAENLEALAPKGRLMLVGLTAGSTAEFNLAIALYKRLKIIGTALRGRTLEEKAAASRAFEREMASLLPKGTLKPNIDKVFSFNDIRAAHEHLESNDSFGKVVLKF
jgi:putative PIG3 family NAD(P)H quinone oxidoreductase